MRRVTGTRDQSVNMHIPKNKEVCASNLLSPNGPPAAHWFGASVVA